MILLIGKIRVIKTMDLVLARGSGKRDMEFCSVGTGFY